MIFILGLIGTLLLGVASNLLTPWFERFFKNDKKYPAPDINENDEPILDPYNVEQWRARNRRKLEYQFTRVYFIGFSYVLMYLSFFLPLVIEGGYRDTQVDLSASKLMVNLAINNDNLSTVCVIASLITFFPFWFVSKKIADFFCAKMYRYTAINKVKHLAVTALIMIATAFLMFGLVTWLINKNITLLNAMTLPGLILIIFFFMGATKPIR